MYNRYRLDNGIRVIAEHIPYVNSISLGVWVKSGSRYENKMNNGVSHFIEHILFKGTKTRTAKKIAEDIEDLGGQINAFTGKEATCYYVKMLDEHINVGIDVLSDMLIDSKFDPDEIEKEKGVVIEEIRMYDDSPEDVVSDLLSIATWGDDTLSYPILGTVETINNINRDIIIDYYNTHYTPSNIVISVAGNFNEEFLLKELNFKFGKLINDNNHGLIITSPTINKDILVRNKDIEQVHFSLTFDGLPIGDEKLYSLLAINTYFGGGTSSRLFQSLREEHGYVYTIYSFPSSYINTGIFNIYFALNNRHINNAMKLIKTEIDNLLSNKIEKAKVNKIKEQLKGSYILSLEGVSSRMFSLGKAELLLNKINEPKDVLHKIDSIDEGGVNMVAEEVFSKGILSAAVVGRNIDESKIKSIMWR